MTTEHTNDHHNESLPAQGPFAPGWAQRLRDFGLHITYACQGWENVPRPQPRVVVCIAGGIWTIFEGPPAFLGDLLEMLNTKGD